MNSIMAGERSLSLSILPRSRYEQNVRSAQEGAEGLHLLAPLLQQTRQSHPYHLPRLGVAQVRLQHFGQKRV